MIKNKAPVLLRDLPQKAATDSHSSFFGKLKTIHSGPPVPPKRTDDNAELGWPQDEFDDEEGDMYEAPPCERPAAKVPQIPVEEENVYLDTSKSPSVPLRKTTPPARLFPVKPPQRSDAFSHDPNTKKPPEVNRNEKPRRNSDIPQLPVRTGAAALPAPPPAPLPAPLPAPPLGSNTEEDVYLDPNEEPNEDDDDDLYLEPAEACAPVPRPAMALPLSPKQLVPSPMPMMKPPVPRAKSNAFLPSLNEVKPAKIPPPPPSVKPPLPGCLKEAKLTPPSYPTAGTKPVVSFGGMRATKLSENENKGWFAQDCDRRTAEEHLQSINKDGAFLIRHCSSQNSGQPYTLAVFYQGKVYNVPVRFLQETRSYALGKEGKKNQETFPSLDEMISHHTNNQLLLIDSKSQAKHTTYLTQPAHP